MCRETSIVCVTAKIVCNRAITVSKCDFAVYHDLLAFHEAKSFTIMLIQPLHLSLATLYCIGKE